MRQQILDLIESIEQYLPNIINASDLIPEQLQSGEFNKALTTLEDYIDGVHWLFDGLTLIKATDDSYLNELHLLKLSDALRELELAIRNNDYVLLTDILQYELKEIFEEYQNHVQSFKQLFNRN